MKKSELKQIIKEEISKALNEIQYKRYTVGYFNNSEGVIEGDGIDGMFSDFGSYGRAKLYAEESYNENPNSIYVVMDEKHVEPHPVLVIGKKTPEFEQWLKTQTMKKSELQQIIKEEIKNILSESSDYPRDVVSTNGNIVTTQDGKNYKVLTTKPKEGSSDFYYDTIMKRVEQLNPEDWDVNVETYKKAIPIR
jgi:hypothetical protein